MRFGIDLDGVLADFTHGYVQLVKAWTGKDIPEVPQTWNWDMDNGVTREENTEMWKHIRSSSFFWSGLRPMGDPSALYEALLELRDVGDLYFITTRPGVSAKEQTEEWLQGHFPLIQPTVLIDGGGKGPLARGLTLTHFIDDRPENIEDVASWSPATRVFLKNAPYNRSFSPNEPPYVDFTRVTDFLDFARYVNLSRVEAA